MTLKHFLLSYDRKANRLVSHEEFEDSREATEAYKQAERNARDGHQELDIVLIGSDSLETVKITHSTYFEERLNALIEQALKPISFTD